MDAHDDRDRARGVPHIATYRRELNVNLERLYENAIDWEHLPFLHRSTFSRIDCQDAGPWGFRARVWMQPYDERGGFVIELGLDRDCRRWITSTLEGPGAGTEIWTHAFSLGERQTLVVVDFFVPGARDERARLLAEYYRNLYARLYDEDESMMTERDAQLDRAKGGLRDRAAGPMRLGPRSEVLPRLPFEIEFGGRRFRIVELDGTMVVYSTVCPHTLGPLGGAPVEGGVIECPWHGYRYDIRTRRCVSGAQLSLAPAPRVHVDPESSEVIVDWLDERAN